MTTPEQYVSSRPQLPRAELWRAVQRESSYTHMVWSIDNDEPYWFMDEDSARSCLVLLREGRDEEARELAAAHA